MDAIARRLSEFTVQTTLSDIDPHAIEFAKCLTLKTVGGMITGSTHPSSHAMAAIVKARRSAQDVGVIGGGFKTSLWDAVLLNGFFAHARELEDDRFGGGVSWDITVIPLLLSMAEKYDLSGKALLEAIVIGLEVHARTCLFSGEHLGFTIVPGAIGPAAGAARALGLNLDQTAAALGIAMSSVNLSLTNFGTDAHYLESSLHSLQAIIAAEMAQKNMTSNPQLGVFISRFLGQPLDRTGAIIAGLGAQWLFTEIMIKKYSCCFLLHRQVDSLLQLRKEHGFTYDDVDRIDVLGSPADVLCDRPEPKTEGDLQFSFHHALGAALLDGDLGLEHFEAGAIDDPRIAAARSKVRVTIDPGLSKIIMEAPARIGVTLRSGTVLTAERMYPIGSIQEPLSVDGVRQVYRKFAKGILVGDTIDRVADAVLDLENVRDVRPLLNMMM